ncbi:MAG: hypothetical protein LBT48_05980 [Prevotellaceae bacterium]|jgi:hypothetical protein|nr:hypothetical protein [Prevotellaceae bacterium]
MRTTVLKFGALLTVIALMLSCSREEVVVQGANEGEWVDFTVSTTIPQSIKTYASDNGGATNVKAGDYDLRYILEVWTKEATPRLAYRGYKIVSDNFATTSVTFTARLLSWEYDFVFWADFVANGTTETSAHGADLYYTTNTGIVDPNAKNESLTGTIGLLAIAIKTDVKAYDISNDARDAFYAVKDVDLRTANRIDNVVLKRPFGKYRVIATDVPDGFLSANAKSTKIKYTAAYESGVTISLPSKFNALTGEIDGSTARTYVPDEYRTVVGAAEPIVAGGKTYNNALVLGFDYIFAYDPIPANPTQTVAFDIDVFSDETASTQVGNRKEISNIPIVRNKLTTIIGNFFTNNFSYTAKLDDIFEGGSTAVGVGPHKTIIIDPATLTSATAILKIPAGETAESVTFILTGNVTEAITIIDENSIIPYEGKVYIGNPDAKKSYDELTIILPGASVTVYDNVTTLDAKTAKTTLTIPEKTTIGRLILKGGNVYIYGTVGDLTVDANSSHDTITANWESVTGTIADAGTDTKFLWRAATEAQLTAVLEYDAAYNDGVILTADIKNAQISTSSIRAFAIGESDPAAYTGYLFDGNGHTLSGYQTQGSNSGNVLVSHSNGVTIKNLTVEKPSNLPDATKLNGLTIHQSTGVTLENITAQNFKQAGIVINGSEVTATNLHTSGNGWGGVNVDKVGAIFDFSDGTSTFAEATKVWVDHFADFNPTVNVLRPAGWIYATDVPKAQTYYFPQDGFSETTDPGIVIGGIIWATRNLGEPGKFVASPFDPGYIYQWNRNVPWTIDKPCDFNYTRQNYPYPNNVFHAIDGSTWDETWIGGGASTWQDADALCPSGWRLPTYAEFEILYNRHPIGTNGKKAATCISYKDVTVNNVPEYAKAFVDKITNHSLSVDTEEFGWTGDMSGIFDMQQKVVFLGGDNGDDTMISPVAGYIRDDAKVDGYAISTANGAKGDGGRTSGFWASDNFPYSFAFNSSGIFDIPNWEWYPGDGLYIRCVKK